MTVYAMYASPAIKRTPKTSATLVTSGNGSLLRFRWMAHAIAPNPTTKPKVKVIHTTDIALRNGRAGYSRRAKTIGTEPRTIRDHDTRRIFSIPSANIQCSSVVCKGIRRYYYPFTSRLCSGSQAACQQFITWAAGIGHIRTFGVNVSSRLEGHTPPPHSL